VDPNRSIDAPNWFSFLKLEAELAFTFIQSAKAHTNPSASMLSLTRAHKALSEIQKRLIKPAAHSLTADQVLFLEKRCAEIDSALKSGQVAPDPSGPGVEGTGVQMIPAYSPQARGRSERSFGTWQARLPRCGWLRSPRWKRPTASCANATSPSSIGSSR